MGGMKIAKVPICHPLKKHEAKGYCKHCYERKIRKYRSPSSGRRGLLARQRRRFRFSLKPKYGINFQQYTLILLGNSGRCSICLDNPPRLEIDHDHRTGQVRGLLCQGCNRAVANYENYPLEPLLSKIKRYCLL